MRYLYDIYEVCEKNECPDITIALAMFKTENPGAISFREDLEMRLFVGRHGEELAEAFSVRDRELFNAAVEKMLAEDDAK